MYLLGSEFYSPLCHTDLEIIASSASNGDMTEMDCLSSFFSYQLKNWQQDEEYFSGKTISVLFSG